MSLPRSGIRAGLRKKHCLKKIYFLRKILKMAFTFGSHMSSLQNPISKRKNYEYFSLTMESFFRGQNVWEIVQNGYIEPIE